MKFIARKGAPNIPLELIEAQESGNLVFFCGAGVSYPAGLPGFADLVENVYVNLAREKTELEAKAIKAKLYDRALWLLEARIVGNRNRGDNIVRQNIIQQLAIPSNANLQTQKAILQLSKTTNQKYRLVTTNVDHGFLEVDQVNREMIDAAPKLPVPKPHKWESIVHLHGLINDADPNGERLVFTSGDFGSAYLTERWASKFTTELFSHFTVLFIGYSVNDPVLRYMTDAIASERLVGDEEFKKPYILAHTKPSKRLDIENAWKAKGIEPVLYTYGHGNFHNTLKIWANYVRDGLNAKARIINKEAPVAPLPPYSEDPGVIRLIDVLSEKTKPNHQEVTGYPARKFKELDNPPAPIEWLPVLNEHGLLSIAQQSEQVYLVNQSPYYSNLTQPNRISLELWEWLLKHLESDDLIHWIIDQGACLHPHFKGIVAHHISKRPPKDPYLRFWKIVTSNYVSYSRFFLISENKHVEDLETYFNYLTLAEISKLLEPAFQLRKAINLAGILGDKAEEFIEKPPFEIEVVIRMSDWVYEKLRKLDSYPNDLTNLLLPATQALKKALELWDYAGNSNGIHDQSVWDMVSISSHPQNRSNCPWIILIELCRDLWETAWDNDRALAQSILELWRLMKYPLFRRLTFHAMTVKDVAEPREVLDYLIEKNGWWIWSVETRREVFRLLAVLWSQLDMEGTNRLIGIILEGPPREMFKADLTQDQWKFRVEREIWLMLAKLENFGRALPAAAEEALNELVSKHEDWILHEGERDEFVHWFETRIGHEVDITIDKLFSKTVPEIVEFLSSPSRQYGEGRIALFRAGCKGYREKVIEVFSYLSTNENWHRHIWQAGLMGFTDIDENTWEAVSPLLVKANPELYREIGWAIARWTRKNAASLEGGSREEISFWSIFTSTLENTSDDEKPNRAQRAIDFAINHPVGIITEALMDRFSVYNLKVGQGIPEGSLQACVNRLLPSGAQSLLAGKIILASRLPFFHAVDTEWTEKNLIPLFNWKESKLVAWIWQGYLFSPRISIDLANALKEHMIGAIEHISQLGVLAGKLCQLFTFVCLEYPEVYKLQEHQNALNAMGKKDLVHVAELFWRIIRDDAGSADNYWRNRIQPFIKKAWPKGIEFISEKSSKYLALTVIELEVAFGEAINSIKSILIPFAELPLLLTYLKDKSLPDKQPQNVMLLLSIVFTVECKSASKMFRDILDRLVKADKEITKDPAYEAIDQYLIQYGY
ncbi:SIR2 family protein [Candidatus Zixiibacteriota bacterium]